MYTDLTHTLTIVKVVLLPECMTLLSKTDVYLLSHCVMLCSSPVDDDVCYPIIWWLNLTSCLLLNCLKVLKNCLTRRLSGSCLFVLPSYITLEDQTFQFATGVGLVPWASLLLFSHKPEALLYFRVSARSFTRAETHGFVVWEEKRVENTFVWKILRF